MENNGNAILGIKRIREIAFHVNEGLFNPGASVPLKVDMQHKLGFNKNTNLLDFTLHVSYRFADLNPGPNSNLMDIEVQNIFEVRDLRQYVIDDNVLKLPAGMITSIVDLSISHTRALMAKNIAGTTLQDQLIVIVNPETVARHFFPNMFTISEPSSQRKNTQKKKVKKGK